MNKKDENELVKAFREQLILEREIEKAKIDLIESCFDFNLFDAFRLVDRDGKGYATAYDLYGAC